MNDMNIPSILITEEKELLKVTKAVEELFRCQVFCISRREGLYAVLPLYRRDKEDILKMFAFLNGLALGMSFSSEFATVFIMSVVDRFDGLYNGKDKLILRESAKEKEELRCEM